MARFRREATDVELDLFDRPDDVWPAPLRSDEGPKPMSRQELAGLHWEEVQRRTEPWRRFQYERRCWLAERGLLTDEERRQLKLWARRQRRTSVNEEPSLVPLAAPDEQRYAQELLDLDAGPRESP